MQNTQEKIIIKKPFLFWGLSILILLSLISIFEEGFFEKKVFWQTSRIIRGSLDIYGTQQLSIYTLEKRYQLEFNVLATLLMEQGIHQEGWLATLRAKRIAVLSNQIIRKIEGMGTFAYVNLSPILYAGDPVVHFTLDIVEERDKQRLAYFFSKPSRHLGDPGGLLFAWQRYENLAWAEYHQTGHFPSFKTCPAHHCLFGFEAKNLIPFESIFQERVPRYQNDLLQILRQDQDENKRARAAYLLAHVHDAQLMLQYLLPSIQDPSPMVRNNVMRVLGYSLMQNPDLPLPIKIMIPVLNYPTSTDRNKAMWIILGLLNQKPEINTLLREAGQALLAELKLSQPNNHELAYLIFKKMSGQHFADRDYEAWAAWLKTKI